MCRSLHNRIKWFRSVRARLLAIALLPMLVVMPLFLWVVGVNWVNRFDNLLIAKVNGDLTIAHQYFQGILERSGERVKALADSAEFARVMQANDEDGLAAYLEAERANLGLDFLYFVTVGGQVISAPPIAGNPDVMKWPVIQQALSGQDATGIDIFMADDLAAFSSDLATQALIKLVPTEAAVPTDRLAETRGMVVHTASAVQADTPAALVGGLLLNRNLSFIDTINDLVYPAASLTEGSRGTATLFLETSASAPMYVCLKTCVRWARVYRPSCARPCWMVARFGWIGRSWSMTGIFRLMNRLWTVLVKGWVCYMSVFWIHRFRRPNSGP